MGGGVATETSQPYLACSSESKEGFCPHVDLKCNALNTARTCGSFDHEGGACTGLDHYPNITISDYGSIRGSDAMMKEIYRRGPVACGVDANPLLNYNGGIVTTMGGWVDHIISVVGWGTDAKVGKYWVVRNSWGEYWGEYGYVRVKFGALSLDSCDWATVADYTAPEKQNYFSCHEGGDNCNAAAPPAPAPSQWAQRNLVEHEGHELKAINDVSASDCERACEADSACHSFSFSSSKKRCHLKDRCVNANDKGKSNHDYVTYYTPCAPCKDSHSWCRSQASYCKTFPSLRSQCKKTCGARSTSQERSSSNLPLPVTNEVLRNPKLQHANACCGLYTGLVATARRALSPIVCIFSTL